MEVPPTTRLSGMIMMFGYLGKNDRWFSYFQTKSEIEIVRVKVLHLSNDMD